MLAEPVFLRRVEAVYSDPLARIWLACAEAAGFRVARSDSVYASSDGQGTLWIGHDALLDADDQLAQMILHELCHALVEGEAGERLPDWGLDNASSRHTWREHACLRLQAALTAPWGLRAFLAPTTDFRVSFWQQLGPDPFEAAQSAGGRREPSCVAARLGMWRAAQPRWREPLAQALRASAAIAALVPRHLGLDAAMHPAHSLWACTEPVPPAHPAGAECVVLPHVADAGKKCADCAWSWQAAARAGRPAAPRLKCHRMPGARLDADTLGCQYWESRETLHCLSCGACCREAYDTVEVGAREAVIRMHPDLVEKKDGRYRLRREGERCAALRGGTTPCDDYSCSIYADRPSTCRGFALGSANCLDARRRIGLSL
ncbi:MAG: hypothetical protein RIQ52_1154 [Pseudomonadota bacterium]|jgi:hypothetical protein